MSRLLNKTSLLIITIVSLLICVGTLTSGIMLHKAILKQNAEYTGSTEAIVADYEVRQEEVVSTVNDIETTTTEDFYYPVFEYTVDGKEYRVVYSTGTDDKAYEENSSVKINYLPSDPTQYYVAEDSFRTFVPYFLYLFSAVSAIAALITIRRFFR